MPRKEYNLTERLYRDAEAGVLRVVGRYTDSSHTFSMQVLASWHHALAQSVVDELKRHYVLRDRRRR